MKRCLRLGPALVCLLLLCQAVPIATVAIGDSETHFKLCSSVSIAVSTYADDIEAASNCTVISGHLMISIVNFGDSAEDSEIPASKARVHFPYLREVSEYVLLYRVSGLTSLDQLFPRLSVIRGLKTLDDFSLVLFDVLHLTSIGLPWLRRVGGRRGIRVDNSPLLCYLNTVHWSRILGPRYASLLHFNHVQDQSQCSNPCPGEFTDVTVGSKVKRAYKSRCPGQCWNMHHCQTLCSESCGQSGCRVDNVSLSDSCCHAYCLAGCDGPGNRNCVACRHFRYRDQCVPACPPGYLQLDGWLCISSQQCTQGSRKRMRLGQRCVADCPAGHLSIEDRCEPCLEAGQPCVKHCPRTMTIRSAQDLKEARGCDSVDALVISLADDIPDLDARLREAFASLTEIKQYLTVTQSRDLTSLSFLSSLRIIGGEHIGGQPELKHGLVQSQLKNISLRIENTGFLQALWNGTGDGHRLLIARGGVLFHRNQRLCPDTVANFVDNVLNISDGFSRMDLGYNSVQEYNSNGNLAMCIESTFNLTVVLSNASALLLHWPHLSIGDARYLLGYHIYYRLVPPNSPPVTYADPSTCEIRQWHTKFTQCVNGYSTTAPADDSRQPAGPYYCHLSGSCNRCVGNCTSSFVERTSTSVTVQQCTFLIVGLKPASQYAVFVVPHIVQQMKFSVQSRLALASTMPDFPSPPDKLEGRPLGTDRISLEWRPPLHPNGNVTHYLVWINEIPVQQENFALTDYCEKSYSPTEYLSAVFPMSSTPPPSDSFALQTPASLPSNATGIPPAACPKCQCESEQRRRLEQLRDDVLFEDVVLASLLHKTELHMRPSDENEMRQRDIENASSELSWLANRFLNRSGDVSTDGRSADLATTPQATKAGGGGGGDFNNFDKNALRMLGEGQQQQQLASAHSPSNSRAEIFANMRSRSDDCSPKCPEWIIRLAASSADNDRRMPDGYLIANGTSIVAAGLNYFGLYAFTVVACQGGPGDTRLCSHPARQMVRTSASRTADAVPDVRCQSDSPGSVRLFWRRPARPNGAVKYFEVDAKLADATAASSAPGSGGSQRGPYTCVSYQDWLGRGRVRRRAAVFENSTDSRLGGIVLRNLAVGRYFVSVRAVTLQGYGDWSDVAVVDVVGPADSHWLVSGLTPLLLAAAAAAVFLACLIGWLRCRRLQQKDTIVTQNPEYWSFSYEPDEWEVPRDQVTYSGDDLLGNGSFGCVYRGMVRSLNTPAARYMGRTEDVQVAVKNVSEKASPRERHEFLREAAHMKKFRQCAHVVRLIGVVSENVPTLVLMELMENGDLKNCLRSMRDEAEPPERRARPGKRRLATWCAQIADGMYYLETKKYIHRDLAARNCMVTKHYSVKIGDFGMTRDVNYTDYYVKEGQAPLPIRWMAPESLRDGVFSTATDVWSYGVVLWEIASLAQQPFNSRSNEEVLHLVKSGKTLEPPDACPEFLVKLMTRCWVQKPRLRASFADLLACLEDLASAEFRRVSWYHNQAQELVLDKQPPKPEEEDVGSKEGHGLDLLQQMTDKELAAFPMIRAPMNGYV